LVDWTTGDPEADRAYMFRAYRAFLNEIKEYCLDKDDATSNDILDIFIKWKVHDLDVDDFPRIQIDYPEDYPEALK